MRNETDQAFILAPVGKGQGETRLPERTQVSSSGFPVSKGRLRDVNYASRVHADYGILPYAKSRFSNLGGSLWSG